MGILLKLGCRLGKHKLSEWEEARFVSAESHRRQRHCLHCPYVQEEVVPHSWEEISSDMDVCLECQTARIFETVGQKNTGIRFVRKKACRDK
jgi:hypothetical protein